MQRCQGIARKRRGRGERQTTPGSARSRRNGARFSLFPLKSHPNHPLTTSPASNWTPVCLGNHTADVTPSAGGGMSVSGWPVNVSPSDWEEAADGGEEKKGGALMVVHTFSCGPGLARAHERRRGGGPKRRRGVHVSRALLAMRDFFWGGCAQNTQRPPFSALVSTASAHHAITGAARWRRGRRPCGVGAAPGPSGRASISKPRGGASRPLPARPPPTHRRPRSPGRSSPRPGCEPPFGRKNGGKGRTGRCAAGK